MDFKNIKDRFNTFAADVREKAVEACENLKIVATLGYMYAGVGYYTVKDKLFPSFRTSIENGDVKAVDASLTKNPALANTALDEYQVSPLHSAAAKDQAGVAAVLLKYGARLDAEDHRGVTPLLIASARGNLPMIELFLAHNDPTLNKLVFGQTQTAASAAATSGHLEALELLHKRGARLDMTTAGGSTALTEVHDRIKFSSSGGSDLVGLRQCFDYLVRNMAEVFPPIAPDANVYTQLMRVARQGDVGLAQVILTGSTSGTVNQRYVADEIAAPIHGFTETRHVVKTALKEAVKGREAAMVDLLLKSGAKQNLDYEGDQTPIMLAAQNGRADMLKLLLDNDTSTINQLHVQKFDGDLPPVRVDFSHSALTYGVESKNAEGVSLLLNHGARTDLSTTRMPLQLAQEEGFTEIVDVLMVRPQKGNGPAAPPQSPPLRVRKLPDDGIGKKLIIKGRR